MVTISELLSKVKKLDIKTDNFVEGTESGNHRSKFRGGGIEFSEVREYMPGDDVKRIDWNVSARFGGLFVKEFVEENELNVFLMIDMSASNNFGHTKTKQDIIFEIASSLVFSALRNNDKFGMGIFTDHLEKFIPSKKGKKHMMKILKNIVEYFPKSKQTDIFKSISEINSQLKRKSIIFIISDLISDSFLQSLKILKLHHKVVLIKISDINEKAIPEIGYVYLEDSETGNQMLVNTSDKNFQKTYLKNFTESEKQIQKEIKKIGIDMMNLDGKKNFDVVFNQYFRDKHRRK
jgi:uncharacterized protein (DUF58 family)